MNYKKILRKLIDQLPADDYREWAFEASNKSSGRRPHYGIVKKGGWHAVSGINVDCPIEDDWHKINPYKFSNIISAFVSFACPANVEKLLNENHDLAAVAQGLIDFEDTALMDDHVPLELIEKAKQALALVEGDQS